MDKATDAIDGRETGLQSHILEIRTFYVIYALSAFSIIHVNRFLNCNVNAHFSGEIIQFLKVLG